MHLCSLLSFPLPTSCLLLPAFPLPLRLLRIYPTLHHPSVSCLIVSPPCTGPNESTFTLDSYTPVRSYRSPRSSPRPQSRRLPPQSKRSSSRFCSAAAIVVLVLCVIYIATLATRVLPRLSLAVFRGSTRPQIPFLTQLKDQLHNYPSPASQLYFSSSSPTVATYQPIFTNPSIESMADKYKNPPQAPPTFTGTKESILADAKAICDRTRAMLDKVVADVPPVADDSKTTFDTVFGPQVEDENGVSLSAHILGFYQYVSADSELRDASTEATRLMDEFGIECNMREDVFKVVDATVQTYGGVDALESTGGKVGGAVTPLNPESARLLVREHKGYIKNGLGLPAGPERDRFKEIKKRLSQIQINFQKNLNEENGGIWFTREELDGVPADLIDGLDKGEDGSDNAGKVRLSFKYPDLFPALKFAKNPDTRRRIFIDNENKCNGNAALFREAVLLRDEAARMLGYPNHAALRLEDKMAKDVKTVDDFLGDLRNRLAAGGVKEIDHLLALKKADTTELGLPFDGNYYLWDHRYYDRLMIEKEFSIDENEIAEYFPLRATVAGMLEIFEELFGFVFVELGPEERARISPTGRAEDIVWHEDVIVFSVWDDKSEGEGFVGYLYLDLHPRQGKYGHAANFNMQPGFKQTNGTRRYPATALVCNFSKPTPTKPSLLKHDEVVTLFHELGHGIHDLAGRTEFSRFHGTSTVRDFVEAPSQMLENWCWSPPQIRPLAATTSRLHFGMFDMMVHAPESHAALEALEISSVYNDLRAQISGIKGPEAQGEPSTWGNGQACFGHLIGGYDAGYYGYLYSQVYSTDMFYTVFKANPMNGTEGRRYRHTVLERGGSQDEMKTLEQFLGRKPNGDAFYKDLGITA
ncbi:metallopeptidase MepB [Sporothrix schenckii 1099-18]|uniref:Metallopeptidase MepB n=1 Tax=Sporothrix schenckii 1099-18 TaxID=1397361 RepID=A0A0F2M347_SPOSC|nr:metallopeptidase MepB [Sporothrix schenckii 1099-18]KJR84138.1 metallopeptidase MepB [Sporothrix schenckii 1099-18]